MNRPSCSSIILVGGKKEKKVYFSFPLSAGRIEAFFSLHQGGRGVQNAFHRVSEGKRWETHLLSPSL